MRGYKAHGTTGVGAIHDEVHVVAPSESTQYGLRRRDIVDDARKIECAMLFARTGVRLAILRDVGSA